MIPRGSRTRARAKGELARKGKKTADMEEGGSATLAPRRTPALGRSRQEIALKICKTALGERCRRVGCGSMFVGTPTNTKKK